MTIKPAGDRALTVEFENEISEETNRKVLSLNRKLKALAVPALLETVPSYRALLIYYDPEIMCFGKMKRIVKTADSKVPEKETEHGKTVHIPVCYGGEYGEDLADVAGVAKLSEEEVIRIHSSGTYRIYMLGFLPGFPYLGGMDKRIAAPRLQIPRVKIPAGSVGIGGAQTGIYPAASPGGWRLIGRTPLKLYDPEKTPAVPYDAGDFIHFDPITPEEFKEYSE